MAIIIFCASILTVVQAQGVVKTWEDWRANESKPIDLLNRVHYEANEPGDDRVQVTPLNKVSSKGGSHCDGVNPDKMFTLTKTFCSIKYYIRWYFQYIMYIWLAGATIFIILNWLLIVTAADKEKQMWTFKKNIKNLIIWVILLTSFYFILNAFVSIVNFIAGD